MNHTTQARGDAVYHFAYGANMAPSVLHRRGVSPIAQQPARIVDSTYTILAFRHRAGYATLLQQHHQPCGPAELPAPIGVLYTLSPSDMERLRRCEQGYGTAVLRCELIHAADEQHKVPARDVHAVAFVSKPWNLLPKSVPPQSQYLALLQEGGKHAGLPAEYLQRLASVPSVRPDGRGLPDSYYDTPSRRILIAILLVFVAFVCYAVVALSPM